MDGDAAGGWSEGLCAVDVEGGAGQHLDGAGVADGLVVQGVAAGGDLDLAGRRIAEAAALDQVGAVEEQRAAVADGAGRDGGVGEVQHGGGGGGGRDIDGDAAAGVGDR